MSLNCKHCVYQWSVLELFIETALESPDQGLSAWFRETTQRSNILID